MSNDIKEIQESNENLINAILDEEKQDEVIEEPKTLTEQVKESKLKFKPVNVKAKSQEPEQQQTEDVDENITIRLAMLQQEIERLKNQSGVKLTAATKKPIKVDFSKLDESSVFDLSIPMEAIGHDLPDTMEIKLRDPAYVGRWINTHAQRLGSMKAVGFTFVSPEDLLEPLKIEIDTDENGQYRFNDVVAMKIPKEKYFAQLRANHLRALNMVNQSKAQQMGKKLVENFLATESDPETGQTFGKDYAKYRSENKMEVYI